MRAAEFEKLRRLAEARAAATPRLITAVRLARRRGALIRELVDATGVSRQTISAWLAGER